MTTSTTESPHTPDDASDTSDAQTETPVATTPLATESAEPEPTPGPVKLTIQEHLALLTGYDEIAIEKHFGAAVDDLNGVRFIRAVLFGALIRTEPDVIKAEIYKRVMGMRLKDVNDFFAKPDPAVAGDVLDDEPVSAEGKDGSAVD